MDKTNLAKVKEPSVQQENAPLDASVAHLYILVFALVTCLFVVHSFFFPLSNNDIWFHLRIGQDIWQSKTIPGVDHYSFTSQAFYLDHEWFAQLFLFLYHKAFGINGLIVLRIGILLSCVGLMLWEFRKYFPLNIFAIVPFVLFATSHAYVRPHLFSWLFEIILIVLLHRKKYLATLPLFVIWANFHGSFILGILVALFIIGKEWLSDKKASYLIIGGLLILAPLFNPYGWEIYAFSSKIKDYTWFVSEWKPYLPASIYSRIWWFTVITFSALFVYLSPKKWYDILFFLGLLFLGFSASRFPIVAVGYLCVVFFNASESKLEFWKQPKTIRLTAGLAIAMLLISSKIPSELNEKNWSGWGIDQRQLPIHAVNFLNKNQIKSRILNDYNFGGYFIYGRIPHQPVFVDGRLEVYAGKIMDDYINFIRANQWKKIVKKHHIEAIVLRPERFVNRHLSKSAAWKLVYFDYNSVIYLKKNTFPEIKELQCVTPWGNKNPENISQSILECNYLLQWNPDFYGGHKILAFLYTRNGENAKAAQEIKKYLTPYPEGINSEETQNLMGKLFENPTKTN